MGIHDALKIGDKVIDLTNMDQESLELLLRFFLFWLEVPPGFSRKVFFENVELLREETLYEIMKECLRSNVAKNHKSDLLAFLGEILTLKKLENRRKFIDVYLEILRA